MKRLTLLLVLLLATQSAGVLYQLGDLEGINADKTITRVGLDSDGDAGLVIEKYVRLENESDEERFSEATQYPYRIEDSYESSTQELVENADEQTTRRMEWSGGKLTIETVEIPRKWGVVKFRFNWTSFANSSNDSLDTSPSLSGYILSTNDALIYKYPTKYNPNLTTPPVDSVTNNSVTWEGARHFDEDEPYITLDEDTPPPTNNSTTPTLGPNTDMDQVQQEPSTGGTDITIYLLLILMVGALVLGASALLYLYRYRAGEHPQGTSLDEQPGTVKGEPGSDAQNEEPAAGNPTSTESSGEEVLTDEERVIRLVESAGGRVKQKQINEETGWSSAKVSKLTSKLEDEGRIEKLRMGRENILELSGNGESRGSGEQ